MGLQVAVPEDFEAVLKVDNARERFDEAEAMARRVIGAGVQLHANLDHAAIFSDPPSLVSGPLKRIGYVNGWDDRCYPSPVDGCDYINVPAALPAGSEPLTRGWFSYVAVVHPVDEAARETMLSHGYGNPFLHHVTWRITAPCVASDDPFELAASYIPFMASCRDKIAAALGAEPGALVIAAPGEAISDPRFKKAFPGWVAGIRSEDRQLEPMQGGGFLIQFFCLKGGRIEVALREGTTQTFNPASVHRISAREISTDQG